MKRGKGNIFFLLLMVGTSPLLSQVPLTSGEFRPEEGEAFMARVKHISDFVQIFNYGADELNSCREEADVLYWQDRRRGAIAYLVHQERLQQADSLTIQDTFEALVRDVLAQACQMDLSGRNWWAETQFGVLYKGQPDTLTLILQKEKLANEGFRWVVVGAQADFLALKPAPDSVFVPPNSADTDFISFREVLRKPDHTQAVQPFTHAYDPLSAYLYAQQQGDIALVYTLRRRLHVLTVAGWGLIVEYEARDRMNAGWLIYDFFEIDDANAYQQSLLHPSANHP